MATVPLTLGAVALDHVPGEETPGSPSVHSAIVGAPPQWSDGSDATYAYVAVELAPDVPVAHAQAEPVDGNLVGFTVTVRASANPDFGPDVATARVYLRHVPTDGYADTDTFEIPADGAIYEVNLTGVLYEDNNPDGWLAEGVYIAAAVNTFGSRMAFYEVAVTVTTAVTEPPVTRLHPRDDGRGLSSAPRLYPTTKASRVVGGYL